MAADFLLAVGWPFSEVSPVDDLTSMSSERTFFGFGFGAIQAGLFLYEAARSGRFSRLVVAEVQPAVVAALRAAGGRYRINIATPAGLRVEEVCGVEVFNPLDPADRPGLLQALGGAEEMATALPSVEFFDRGPASVARLLAEADPGRGPPAVLYTGENHNHAAALLEAAVRRSGPGAERVQFLDTVIGKMSGVVVDPAEIAAAQLATVTPDLTRAFLVEAFNRILISRIRAPGFARGLTAFAEKADLLPFEEAKLYGHNATHALLGLLAHQRGYRFMSELAADADLLQLGRQAFLEESGAALIQRHAGVDDLFTPAGYRAYAEDLLTRMVNPFLRDAVARVIRDPLRKLGWEDRLVGTMRLALAAGLPPTRYARGARAALDLLALEHPGVSRPDLLDQCWMDARPEPGLAAELKELIEHAC